jgi:hypothetical protein
VGLIPLAGSSPVLGIIIQTYTFMIIKQVVSPFQKVLLSRRLCVGCTQPLDKAARIFKLSESRTVVQCKCKRRYILDKEVGNYRRASFEEDRLLIEGKKK